MLNADDEKRLREHCPELGEIIDMLHQKDVGDEWLHHMNIKSKITPELLETIAAQMLKLIRENERLISAINWALGVGDFLERGKDDPPYWWRNELSERAGLEYDGEKFIISIKEADDEPV